MVAVGAGVAGPNRQFSGFILGGLWPRDFYGSVDDRGRRTAHIRSNLSCGRARHRRVGFRDPQRQRWRMIEAMHVTYQGDSKAVEAQADLFASMADAIDECVRIVDDARSQMDAIDQQAHDAIQKVIDSKGGWFGALAMMSMIWAILTQARAAAEAASAAAAGNIASQAAQDSKGQPCRRRAEWQARRCRPPRTARTETATSSWRVTRSSRKTPPGADASERRDRIDERGQLPDAQDQVDSPSNLSRRESTNSRECPEAIAEARGADRSEGRCARPEVI